jgi:dolichol-phosphate mannosyltransferase
MRPLVVIPTYNESENIERMLHRIRACLPEAGILVVDDGSPDGTASLVETVAAELAEVHLIRRTAKAGLGSAYRTGFAWGLERGYDAFVEIDADFSHDPAALPGLLAPLEQGYDVSIGSRYVEGGSIPNWAWHRHLLSRGGNAYADAVLGLGVHDSTAGFRAYRADILRRLDLERIRAEGYGFQIEMTYRAKQHGATVCEVPISFVDRTAGESKMSSFIVIEALALVTWWGLGRVWHALRRGGTRRTSPTSSGSRQGEAMVGGNNLGAGVSGNDGSDRSDGNSIASGTGRDNGGEPGGGSMNDGTGGSGTEHPVRSA